MATLTLKNRKPLKLVSAVDAEPGSKPAEPLVTASPTPTFDASTAAAMALAMVPNSIADQERFNQAFDACRSLVGWDEYSAADIKSFFKWVANPADSDIVEGSLKDFSEEPVPFITYRHSLGLIVSVIEGAYTYAQVRRVA